MRLFAMVVSSCVLILILATFCCAQTSSATTPVVSHSHTNILSAQYVGPTGITQYLASGQAQPLSMTHADFYGDGNDSLAIGYGTADGSGVLSLRRAHANGMTPRTDASSTVQVNSQSPSLFASTATVLALPTAPNFLATGQFLGQIDLVTAAQGGNAIYVLAGDGTGNFAAPRSLPVSGPISAMATGRFGSNTQTNSILIGTSGPQPTVSLYRRSASGIALVATYPLQSPASSFDFDDLDGDGCPDAVMVSGGNVLILHATGANGTPQLETLSLPFSAVGVLSGFFTHDRTWRRQMAVLDSNNTVHIVVHGGFDARPWIRAEIKAMRDALVHNLPNPFRRMETGPATDGWKVLESFAGMAGFSNSGQAALFLRTSFLRRGTDEVLVVNSAAGQASLISHTGTQSGAEGFITGEESLLPVPSAPMTAAAMTVSPGQPGLVMLTQNSTEPMVSAPTSPITFTVNTTADTVDANPGDGTCADASKQCSLRAAIMEVNAEAAKAVVGPFQITLPAGNFNLTIPGRATTDASTGHLDVNAPVTIVGAGASATTITQTNPNGDQDMVFLIDAAEDLTPDYAVTIQGLTITGGHANSANLLAQGGGIHWQAGANGTGSLTLNSVNIQNNFATDPADAGLDDGGGLALFNTAAVTQPAAVTITGPSTIGNNAAFDAGGGIALKGAVSLTMTGATVTGNRAVGSGIQQGGGLYFYVANNPPSGKSSSPSFIHGSILSNNTAGAGGTGEGGGIWTDQSLTIDRGSVVSGNTGGTGGGIAIGLQGATDQVTITASTITGNGTGGGNGGGIEVDAGSKANLNLSFNRIFGNTVSGGGAGTGLYNAGSGTPPATDNWWGCNGGPQLPGDLCDQTAGSATVSPWIQLSFTANPNPVLVLSSTTLTAAFQDSNPNFAANLNALVGLQANFSGAVNGSLGASSGVIGSNGKATVLFTPSSGPTAQANVQVDNATVTATVGVMDFAISASPTSQTINVGTSTATYQITVGPLNGFSGTVALSCGNSDGLSCGINPSQITASGTATLTIQTGSAAPGSYPNITVVGTTGNVSHQVAVQLNIADFAVSISPTSQTVADGAKATYSVTVSSTTGFNGPISLGVNGLPSGTVAFSPGVVNLAGQSSSANSTLTVTTTASGTYSFTILGTSQTNVTRSSSNAQLTVETPPTIYRPSTFSGQYAGGQYAFDGNLSTFANFQKTGKGVPPVTATEVWSAWSKPTGTPVSIVLSVTSSVSGMGASAAISWSAGNWSGTIYSSTQRSETTDTVTLPSYIDISALRVTAQATFPGGVYLESINHNVYEIFVTVVAR